MKAILTLALMLMSCVAVGNGFYHGMCSMYTEAGEWEISYGRQDPRFHCVLIQHRLGPTYSPIADTFSGWYDAYDMNRTTVTCDGEGNAFVVDDVGHYGIERAFHKAKRMEATHCLFEVEPHFQ